MLQRTKVPSKVRKYFRTFVHVYSKSYCVLYLEVPSKIPSVLSYFRTKVLSYEGTFVLSYESTFESTCTVTCVVRVRVRVLYGATDLADFSGC